MSFCLRSVEFRASSDASEPGDGRTLEGYAAVFGQDTEINSWEGRFVENFAPGSFKKTLRENKGRIVMQFNHGRDSAIGATPIGVYDELKEDPEGLAVRGRIFDNALTEPVRQAIAAKAITGMSIAMRVMRDEWRDAKGALIKDPRELDRLMWGGGDESDRDRLPVRRIVREAQLSEAGPVVFPAYQQTSVGVRSEEDITRAREDLINQYRSSMVTDDEDDGLAGVPAVLPEPTPPPLEMREALEIPTSEPDDAVREDTSSTETADAAPDLSTSAPAEDNHPTREVPVNIHDLRARLAQIDERMLAIDTEHRDATLPEATQTEFDGLDTERSQVLASIAAIEARTQRMADFAASNPTNVRSGFSGGSAPAFQPSRDVHDIAGLRASCSNDEQFRDALRDNAMRFAEKAFFPAHVDREAAQGHIEHLLHRVDDKEGTLAKRMLTTGSPLYNRAFGKAVMAGSIASLTHDEQRAMLAGVDSQGGYAIPVQLDNTVILTNNGSLNPIRAISRVEKITGKVWEGVTTAGVTVSRAAEGAEASDNSFTLAQPTVKTNRVQGFIPFTVEAEMEWSALGTEISRMLGDAREREENSSFTLGDGTGTNANGVVTTLNGSSNVLTAAAGTFAAADLYALEAATAPRFRTPNARILANKSIYEKVRQFDTTNGHALWVRIGAGQPSELLGYSALEAYEMDSTVATGKNIALFGEFENFLIVDRIGMTVELIPQIFGLNNRPTGQRGIYAYWMNNTKILVDNAFRLLKVQ